MIIEVHFYAQLKDFFGLPIDKMPAGFFAVMDLLRITLPQFDPLTLAISMASLLLILFWLVKFFRILWWTRPVRQRLLLLLLLLLQMLLHSTLPLWLRSLPKRLTWRR